MKKIYLLLIALFLVGKANSQSAVPYGFNYQTIARDALGLPIVNTQVKLRISVIQGNSAGIIVYQEQQTSTTNQFGLVNLVIGKGTNTGLGTLPGFSSIDWASNNYFISVEVDKNNAWVSLGISQFQSVPYSLAADNTLKIQGQKISGIAPTAGQYLVFNAISGQWEPSNISGANGGTVTSVTGLSPIIINGNAAVSPQISIQQSGSGVDGYLSALDWAAFNSKIGPANIAGGDLTGTFSNFTVTGLQGNSISATTPTNGQVLTWNDLLSQWEPASVTTGTVISVTGNGPITVTNGGTTPSISINQANSLTDGYITQADYVSFTSKLSTSTGFGGDISGTSSNISVDKIKNTPIDLTGISPGQVLSFNGTSFVPAFISFTNVSITSATLGVTTSGLNFEIGTSSGTSFGLLSPVDWNNFNNKVNTIVGLNGVTINQAGSNYSISGISLNSTSIAGINGILVNQSGQGFTLDGSNLLTSVTGANGISINQSGQSFTVTGAAVSFTSITGIGISVSPVGTNSFTINGTNLANLTSVGFGDVSGSLASGYTVTGLQGAPINKNLIANNSLLQFDGTSIVGYTLTQNYTTITGANGITVAGTGYALTIGGTAQGLTSQTASVSTSGLNFEIGTASGTSFGLLSPVDWNNFNNKLSQPVSIVGVSGATVNGSYPSFTLSGVNNAWLQGGNSVSGITSFGTSTNFDLPFITNGNEALRITSAGDILVNTPTSIVGARFEIKESASAGRPSLAVLGGPGGSANIVFGRSSSEGGIGIAGSNAFFSNLANPGDIILRAAGANNNLILSAKSASGDIIFSTGLADTPKMVVSNAGNVSITGSAFVNNLAIKGLSNGILSVDGLGNVSVSPLNSSSNQWINTVGSFNSGIYYPNTFVGIGKLPGFANDASLYIGNSVNDPVLFLDGGSPAINFWGTYDAAIFSDGNDGGKLKFSSGLAIDNYTQRVSNTRMTIDPTNGNIGIATTNPNEQLTIQGNSSVAGIGYFGTIIGNNLAGANGSVVTVDGFGKLGIGILAASSQWVTTTAGNIYYNAGKVGIGNINPADNLHIFNSTTGSGITLQSTSPNDYARLTLSSDAQTWTTTLHGSTNAGGNAGEYLLYDNTAGATRLRVLPSTGNVVIGNATLPANEKLTIEGNATILGVGYANGFSASSLTLSGIGVGVLTVNSFGVVTTTSLNIISSQWVNTTSGIYYNNFVGIGTLNPLYQLHISSTSGAALRIDDNSGNAIAIGSKGNIAYLETSGGLQIKNNTYANAGNGFGGTIVTIDPSGNFGINTNPNEKLTVQGNGSVTGIGYFGTIIGNNLTGAAGSIVTVDGFGQLGIGTLQTGVSGTGTAGQIPFWNSPTNLTGNSSLTWDNVNNILGLGAASIKYSTPASANIFMGGIGANSSGTRNIFMGDNVANGNLNTGGNNLIIGFQADYYLTSGASNVILGYAAGNDNQTGSSNVLIGSNAGFYNHSNGNVYIGNNAGQNASTALDNNIAIGNSTDISGALTNAIVIGYSAVATQSNTMMLGGTGSNAVKIGIGTATPNQQLVVVGNSSVTGTGYFGTIVGNNLAGAPGSVVTVDGFGKLGIGALISLTSTTLIGINGLSVTGSGFSQTIIGQNFIGANGIVISSTGNTFTIGNTSPGLSLFGDGINTSVTGSNNNYTVLGIGQASQWVNVSSNQIYTNSFVGIGALSPNNPLTVQSNSPVDLAFFESFDSGGSTINVYNGGTDGARIRLTSGSIFTLENKLSIVGFNLSNSSNNFLQYDAINSVIDINPNSGLVNIGKSGLPSNLSVSGNAFANGLTINNLNGAAGSIVTVDGLGNLGIGTLPIANSQSTTITGANGITVAGTGYALTIGGTSQALTSQTASVTTSGLNFEIGTSSGTSFGLLSPVDWNNFNNKVNTIVGLNGVTINQAGSNYSISGISLNSTSIAGINGILVNQSGQGFTLDGSNLLTSVTGANGISINQSGQSFTVTGAAVSFTSITGIGISVSPVGTNSFTINGTNLANLTSVGFGDVSGSLASGYTVTGLQGAPINKNLIANNSLLQFDGTSIVGYTLTQNYTTITGANGITVAGTGYALTIGGTAQGLTSQTASVSTSGLNFEIGTASGTSFGLLSPVDFNSFNAKVSTIIGLNGITINQLGGNYSISGNNLSQWTTSGANVYYDQGNVGIGTNSPNQQLAVQGSVSVTGVVYGNSLNIGSANVNNLVINSLANGLLTVDGFGNVTTTSLIIPINQWITSSPNAIYTNSFVGIGNTTAIGSSLLSVGVTGGFQVDNTGNIITLNNQSVSFPGANMLGYLRNDGVGNLSWSSSSIGGVSVGAGASSFPLVGYTNTNLIDQVPVINYSTSTNNIFIDLNSRISFHNDDYNHSIGYSNTLNAPTIYGYAGGALAFSQGQGQANPIGVALYWKDKGGYPFNVGDAQVSINNDDFNDITATLDVNGNVRIRNLSISGSVITDALGNLSVSTVAGGSSQWVNTTGGIAYPAIGVGINAPPSTGGLAIGISSGWDLDFVTAAFSTATIHAPDLSVVSDTDLKFFTNGSNERMRVTTGGNIGIGTSTPNEALVVAGNSSVTGIGYFGTIIGHNLAGAAGSVVTVDGNGVMGLGTLTATSSQWTNSSSNSIYTNSLVGIGGVNSGGSSLLVFGSVLAATTNLYNTGVMDDLNNTSVLGSHGITENQSGDMYLRSYWGVMIDRHGGNQFGATKLNYDEGTFAVRYRIDPNNFRTDMIVLGNGNVGIGNTSPNQALAVVGNSSVTGIGYFGTIIGNNLTGAAGSVITVDGAGKLGLGTIATSTNYFTILGNSLQPIASNDINVTFSGGYQIGGVDVIRRYGNNTSLMLGGGGNAGSTGDFNYFIGAGAGASNTVGAQNVFIGYQAGFFNAGGGLPNGSDNSFVGYLAGRSNTVGKANTFYGSNAGLNNISGDGNVYIGKGAGQSNTTGSNNNIVGARAGSAGSNNNIIGADAATNAGGNYNTYFGDNAANNFRNVGSYNIALGASAMSNGGANPKGSYNIVIGSNADIDASSATLSNSIAIGKNALASSNYVMALGGTGVDAVNVGIGTGAPVAQLDVIGSSRISQNLTIGGLAGASGSVITVDGFGKLGIGTLSFTATQTTLTGANGISISGTGFLQTITGPNVVASQFTTSGANIVTSYNTSILGNLTTTGIGYFGTIIGNNLAGAAGSVVTVDGFGQLGLGIMAASPNYLTIVGNSLQPIAANDINISTTTAYKIGGNDVLRKYSANNSLVIGSAAGSASNTGDNNIFYGFESGLFNTSGANNLFLGYYAGRANTTGANNNIFGYAAGEKLTIGNDNNMLGSYAGESNTTGSSNNFLGNKAGNSNTIGTDNNFFGYYAGIDNTTGSFNNIIGNQDNNFLVDAGTHNNFIGTKAGFGSNGTIGNNFIGYQAGLGNTSGSYNIAIGYSASFAAGLLTNSIAFGSNTTATGSNQIVMGANITGLGINIAPTAMLDVNGGARIRNLSITGSILTVDGLGNVGMGTIVASTPSQWITASANQIYTNSFVGIGNATPTSPLSIQDVFNSFGGHTSAIFDITHITPNNVNKAIQLNYSVNGTGGTMLFTGIETNITGSPNGTPFVQTPAYSANINVTGNGNVVGFQSAVGGSNVGKKIGFDANVQGIGGTQNIGINVTVAGATNNYAALLNGGNVGIGTGLPTNTLHVVGGVRFENLSITGAVITVDGSGNLGIGTLPSSIPSWQLGGNSLAGVSSFGTTSPTDIPFIANGTEWMRIASTGKIGIGTSTPGQALDIVGQNPGAALRVNTAPFGGSPFAIEAFNNTSNNFTIQSSNGYAGAGAGAGKFTVSNFANTSAALYASTNSTGTGLAFQALGKVRLESYNISGSVITVDGLGNLGMGTISVSPAWQLGGNSLTGISTTTLGTSSNNDFALISNNTERVRITSSGNVGINNPSPFFSTALDLIGYNGGPALKVQAYSVGGSPYAIQADNSANFQPTIQVSNGFNGTGSAAQFSTTNPSNGGTSAVVKILTNSTVVGALGLQVQGGIMFQNLNVAGSILTVDGLGNIGMGTITTSASQWVTTTNGIYTTSVVGIGVNTFTGNEALRISSFGGTRGLALPYVTTAQMVSLSISGLTNADQGMIFWDSDDKDVAVWDGVQFQAKNNNNNNNGYTIDYWDLYGSNSIGGTNLSITGFGAIGTADAYGLRVRTNNLDRMVVSSTGGITINNTSSVTEPALQVNADIALGTTSTTNDGAVVIWLQNNSVSIISKGDLVVVGGSDNSFDKTASATQGDNSVIGVLYENCLAGQVCRVAISGVVFVNTSASVTRGQHVICDATTNAGKAVSVALPSVGSSIGVFLESKVAGSARVVLR